MVREYYTYKSMVSEYQILYLQFHGQEILYLMRSPVGATALQECHQVRPTKLQQFILQSKIYQSMVKMLSKGCAGLLHAKLDDLLRIPASRGWIHAVDPTSLQVTKCVCDYFVALFNSPRV